MLSCEARVLESEHGDRQDVANETDPVVLKSLPASLLELEDVDEEELVPMKTKPSSQPELEDVDEDELVPMKTKPSSQPELEDVDENELVPVKTKPSSRPELSELEDSLAAKEPTLEAGLPLRKPQLEEILPEKSLEVSPNVGGRATENQTNEPEVLDALDAHAPHAHLLLVEELVHVFTSHQWNRDDSELQLAKLSASWREKKTSITAAEAANCAVEACMKARQGLIEAINI